LGPKLRRTIVDPSFQRIGQFVALLGLIRYSTKATLVSGDPGTVWV
jgi:hypothetical protein